MSAEPAPSGPAAPGGVASGEADLWCTYAAIRTMTWLGRLGRLPDRDLTAAYLRNHRNPDGGYGPSRGVASDAWATFYCTQALADLGIEIAGPERTAAWLGSTWSQGAYAMTPGAAPDVWATYFSTRTALTRGGVPDPAGLATWLSSLQTADGGLGWTPGHARQNRADVRACHYGVAAWQALNSSVPTQLPWNVPALVDWIRACQTADAGFRFSCAADVPCLWATYRALAALRGFGAGPARPCTGWILGMRGPSGAFVRWRDYGVEDVWASFCGVGALRALGEPTAGIGDAVATRIAALACHDGGFTYREPRFAGDVLSTAASILMAGSDGPGVSGDRAWLQGCQLPNEGGLMYMPARGSELRCTLWGLAAGAFAGDSGGRNRITSWLSQMQNPDGGFGYWEGRGSDLVSCAAAVEVARLLGVPVAVALNPAALRGFVRRCRHPCSPGYDGPGSAAPRLRPSLQAVRVLHAVGDTDARALTVLLDRHRVKGGGWANSGNRVPDLLSTYEAVVTADLHGVPVDLVHLRRFVDRVHTSSGTAWTPMGAPASGGLLARCLAGLLRKRLSGSSRILPALTLS
jgi:prenyltransferase beta subunit